MESENIPHGRGGYTNHGCKCEICTDAQRLAQAEYMSRRPEQRAKKRMKARLARGVTQERAEQMEADFLAETLLNSLDTE